MYCYSIPYFGEDCHMFVALFLVVWYIEDAAYPFWQQKGGVHMLNYIISLVNSIIANTVTYLIRKWLDRIS